MIILGIDPGTAAMGYGIKQPQVHLRRPLAEESFLVAILS